MQLRTCSVARDNQEAVRISKTFAEHGVLILLMSVATNFSRASVQSYEINYVSVAIY
jgi:hypothetical protein